ncbi:MAG: response regulator [Halieaceae bacterium]|jgi:signal transduction histidine kinase/CheY-like chemotaxis protein|nr:response regulator [Halieaceae bacterium]
MSIFAKNKEGIDRYLSFVTTFTSGLIGGIFLLSLVLFALFSALSTAKDRGNSYADILAYNLQASLAFSDQESARVTLESVANISDVTGIEVIEQQGSVFVKTGSVPEHSTSSYASFRSFYVARSLVTVGNENLGVVRVAVTLDPIYTTALQVSAYAFLLWLLALMFSVPLTRALNRRVTLPLARISELMKRSAAEETFDERVKFKRNDELGETAAALNNLLDRVADRDTRLSAFIEELTLARDAAESATRAKSSFLANMSHEIRTPMNGVVGLIDLVKLEGLNDKQLTWITSMERSAEALLNVIDDILDFTKIESGKLNISPSDFELSPCIESVMDLFYEQATTRNIALTLTIDESAPTSLFTDQGRLRQILTNLIGNAFKFTTQGRIEVIVGVATIGVRPSVRVTVSDTGIGIPKDQFDLVFARFQQIESGLTRRYGGAGLGLSICKELASLMGGTMDFESSETSGSQFWFDIPIESSTTSQSDLASDAAPALERNVPLLVPSVDDSDISVMVAEDSQVNQFIIKELLKNLGVDATMVDDGAQAIAASEHTAYDLIFMDVSMPVMDGLTATQKIRARECAGDTQTMIVGLSAHAMLGDVERAIESGMDDYITKPISLKTVRHVLQTLKQRRNTD